MSKWKIPLWLDAVLLIVWLLVSPAVGLALCDTDLSWLGYLQFIIVSLIVLITSVKGDYIHSGGFSDGY